MAAGILVIVLGALGSAALYSSANEQHSVVSVTQPVARGTEVTSDHLGVVQVPAGFPVDTLPAEELDHLVGRTALTDLPAGSFPLAVHVGDDPLPEGQALVGFRMHHGQLPMSPMPAGTTIQLVDLSGTESPAESATTDDAPDEDASTIVAPGASAVLRAVVAVAPVMLDDGASFALDVLVPVEHADRVAQLAAAGELAVVVVKEP